MRRTLEPDQFHDHALPRRFRRTTCPLQMASKTANEKPNSNILDPKQHCIFPFDAHRQFPHISSMYAIKAANKKIDHEMIYERTQNAINTNSRSCCFIFENISLAFHHHNTLIAEQVVQSSLSGFAIVFAESPSKPHTNHDRNQVQVPSNGHCLWNAFHTVGRTTRHVDAR